MTKETRTSLHHLSRIIRRARDYYVRNISELAGRVHHGAAAAVASYPCICATAVPNIYSFSGANFYSVDEDLRDLISFASRRHSDLAAGEVRVGERSAFGRRRKRAVAAVVPV